MSKKDIAMLIPKPIRLKLLGNQFENDYEPEEKEVEKLDSIEEILPFEDIKEGIMKIKEGKYRLFAQTNAISVDDLDEDDVDTIFQIYGEWLNSQSKPFQLYIPSYMLDIREEIENMEKIKEDKDDEKELEWIESDIEYQKNLIEENDIIDTKFYFVFGYDFVPSGDESKDFLKAKKDLLRQFKNASDQLEGIGLYLNIQDKKSIGNMLYYFFNPFAAGIQEPNFSNDDMIIMGNTEQKKKKRKVNFKKKNENHENEEEIVFSMKEKKTNHLEKGSLSFKEKISPYSINDKESSEYIKIGSTYMSIFEVYDYSTNVGSLWNKKLSKYKNNIDISYHIKPIATNEILRELEKANRAYGSATIDEKTGKKRKAMTRIDKKMERSASHVDAIMDKLDESEEMFFHFSLYIACKARSREELVDLERDIEQQVLGGMKVLYRKTTENMRNALFTVAPFGLDFLETTRNMLTEGVSNSFPFANYTYNIQNGLFLGIHKYNQSFVRFDPMELENGNGCILGTSGSGKSVTTKKIAKELSLYKDSCLWIIDPEGEMSKYGESLNAQIVDYYAGSKNKINILEVVPDDEVESLIKPQINFVKLWIDRTLDVTKTDLSNLDYALIHLYNKFGFYDNKDTYYDDGNKEEGVFTFERNKRKAPELIDLYNLLNEGKLEDEIGCMKHVASQLREWTRLGSKDLFDGQTNVDFSNRKIIFNLKKLDKSIKDVGILVLMQKLWDLTMQNPDIYKVIYVEELHYLMRSDEMGEYMFDFNKRIRKYFGMTISVTQNVTDFMKNKWGEEIIKNCSWTVLMKQKKQDVDILKDIYEMYPAQARRMTRFNKRKGEGYFIVENHIIPINVKVSERELDIFGTSQSDKKSQAVI